MIKIFYSSLIFLAILFLQSCNSSVKNKPDKEINIKSQTGTDSVSYKIFLTENNTYGFDIIVNHKIFIHQPFIPLNEGINGFARENAAESVAQMITAKLRSGKYRFLINKYEIDSLDNTKKMLLSGVGIRTTPETIKTKIGFSFSSKNKNDTLIEKLASLPEAPVKNLWKSKGIVPFGQRQGALSFSIGNFVFIGAGFLKDVSTDDFWCYNTVTDVWTCLAEIPGGRGWTEGISFVVNGKGYIGLGTPRGDIAKSFTKYFYEYDPIQNKWFAKESFPGSARIDAASFAINNKGYTGLGYDGKYQNDFYEYDPSKDKWKRIADFEGGPVSASIGITTGTKGFIVGGDRLSNNKKYVYEYLPHENIWLKRSDFSGHARYFLTGWGIDTNFIIAGAGGAEGGAVHFRDFFLYDISKDKWSVIPDYLVSKAGITELSGGSVDGKVYAGTGYNGVFFNDWNEFEYYFSVRKDTGVYNETVCYPLQYNGKWEIYQECLDDDCYAGAQIKSSEKLGDFCYSSSLSNIYEEISLTNNTNKPVAKFILLPRSFTISTEKTPAKEVGLRLFFTREEIENLARHYEKVTGKKFSLNNLKILQYNDKQPDLDPLNNLGDLNHYKIISPQLFSYGFQGEILVAGFTVAALQSEFYLAIESD